MMRRSDAAAIAAMMLAVGACSKAPCPEDPVFNLDVVAFEDATKSNYLTEQLEERRIYDLCYLVVDAGGHVVARRNTSCGGGYGCTFPMKLAPGNYEYVVVANGPDISGCSSLGEALSTPVPFAAYNNPSSGYCMAVRGGFSVDRRVKSVSCVLSRLAARVCLRSLTSELPTEFGAFVPEYCALENAFVGSLTLQGEVSGTPERARMSGHELSGLSIKSGESIDWTPPLCHYAYPDNGLAGTTVLTLAGRIGGILYYYPIRLPRALESNTTVALDLTIRNLGSADPLVPAEEGAIEASVTLERWKEGNTHSSEI